MTSSKVTAGFTVTSVSMVYYELPVVHDRTSALVQDCAFDPVESAVVYMAGEVSSSRRRNAFC